MATSAMEITPDQIGDLPDQIGDLGGLTFVSTYTIGSSFVGAF